MANVNFEYRKELEFEEHEKQKRSRLDAIKELVRGPPSLFL